MMVKVWVMFVYVGMGNLSSMPYALQIGPPYWSEAECEEAKTAVHVRPDATIACVEEYQYSVGPE